MSSSESTTDDTARVLEAISDCKSSLTCKIEEVKIDVSLIRQDLQKLRERVTETETRISRVEDEMPPLQQATDHIQQQLHSILSKQDDMENRLRRCNLRFVGLPEGSDPPAFLENLLISTFWASRIFNIIRGRKSTPLSGKAPTARCTTQDTHS